LMKAAAAPPDLVILDVMMPDVDGYHLCRLFRENPKLSRVPILILTARAQAMDRDESLKAGADAYLAKPFPRAELLRLVHDLLEGHAEGGEGRLVSLLSLRGGVGVSSLAVNVAVVLAVKHHAKVLLADLDLSSGQGALMLNLKPKDFWPQAAVSQGVLDWARVEGSLEAHSSGVYLLPAPALPFRLDRLPPATLPSLAKVVRKHFGVVIADLPSTVGEPTVEVLQASDLIVLVMAPEVASLQATTGALHMLQTAGCATDKVWVALNHNAPTDGLPQATIEKVLGRPMVTSLPYEAHIISEAMAKGKPAVLEKVGSNWAKGAADLADKMAIELRT
jgi:pilus assembly protein CpaE